MAVIIDEVWLEEQGVKATPEEAEELLDLTMDELEVRVGTEIAAKLTDKQIAEFEKIESEEERAEWLDNAVPTYPQIADEKIAEITAELATSKDKLALIRSWQ